MDDRNENMIDGLAGAGKSAESADELRARVAELEKRYNAARVEEGRVRKLDEAVKERDRRIAELEERLRDGEIGALLSPEDDALVPDEVKRLTSKAAGLVDGRIDALRRENEQRFRELEERTAAERAQAEEAARRDFVARIEREFPGFLASVSTGGDKEAQWLKYQRYNAASIREAMASRDLGALSYHVKCFYENHLGVRVPDGGNGPSAPDPRASGGGAAGGAPQGGRPYTLDEFDALFDQKEAARERGDWAEVRRITDEINRARAEGRVK